jgi:6-phosphogluconolactonase
MVRDILKFSSESDWVNAIVKQVEDLAIQAANHGQAAFHMSLAGGSTPEPVYRALSASSTLSSASAPRIHIWVGDERDVAFDSVQRNGFLIGKTFDSVATRAWYCPPTIHLWPAESRERSASLYGNMIREELGSSPRFDLFILGVGIDGHTAGLFSVSDAISDGFPYTILSTAPKEPVDRMSMRGSLIRSSNSILILARGKDKRAVLQSFLEGLPSPLTIASGYRGLAYYLDI